MAIAEMTPGSIALIATVGCIFPSRVIVTALAYVYYRFWGLSIVQGVLADRRWWL